MIKATNLQP